MDRLSPGRLGLRTYDKARAFPGYTLFSTAFGYTEFLIDIVGMVVHTWSCEHSQLGEILPNGNLLVDNYGSGLREMEPDGTVVWEWEGPYHHDFERLSNGNTVMLIAREEPSVEGFYPENLAPEQMRTDIVIEVNGSGETVWEFSFSDHIRELGDLGGLPWPVRYSYLGHDGMESESAPSDWAHTNTIEVLPETPLGRRDARFRAGNLLFSFRALDIIGVIDRKSEEIVWAWGLGILDGQHQPTMVDDGNILIFDNGTYRGYSKAVEVDPETDDVVWEYEDGSNFYSPFRSGVQRLPNGNTLICESDSGRIFEVTSGGDVVWDYWSPFLGQGEAHQGRHVYRATRYTEEQIMPVFESRKEKITAVADGSRKPIGTFIDAMRFYQKGLDP
jgi:hypothetical protein